MGQGLRRNRVAVGDEIAEGLVQRVNIVREEQHRHRSRKSNGQAFGNEPATLGPVAHRKLRRLRQIFPKLLFRHSLHSLARNTRLCRACAFDGYLGVLRRHLQRGQSGRIRLQ